MEAKSSQHCNNNHMKPFLREVMTGAKAAPIKPTGRLCPRCGHDEALHWPVVPEEDSGWSCNAKTRDEGYVYCNCPLHGDLWVEWEFAAKLVEEASAAERIIRCDTPVRHARTVVAKLFDQVRETRRVFRYA